MNDVPQLIPGGTRTMLSASLANEIIRTVNAIRRIRARNGVKVSLADGGIVIEGSGAGTGTDTPGGGGGDGLIWGGQWVAASSYAEKTIVLRGTESEFADGDLVGSFISKIAVPSNSPGPNTAGGDTYWETFAPHVSDVFVVRRGDYEVKIDVRASAGFPIVSIESNRSLLNGGRVVIDLDHLNGKYARFIEVDVCEGGIPKKMLVLGTDPYIP